MKLLTQPQVGDLVQPKEDMDLVSAKQIGIVDWVGPGNDNFTIFFPDEIDSRSQEYGATFVGFCECFQYADDKIQVHLTNNRELNNTSHEFEIKCFSDVLAYLKRDPRNAIRLRMGQAEFVIYKIDPYQEGDNYTYGQLGVDEPAILGMSPERALIHCMVLSSGDRE